MMVAGHLEAQIPGNPIQFQENKGQWNDAVLYRGEVPGGYIFLRNNGFTYSLFSPQDLLRVDERVHGHRPTDTTLFRPGPGRASASQRPPAGTGTNDRDKAVIIHGHAYEMNFLDANPHPLIEADHQDAGVYNYLLGKDPSRWAGSVRAFEGITYKGMYDKVDLRVYSQQSQLKYDLIVYPGGRPEKVRIQYRGADKLSLSKGHLHIETSVGEVIEVAPYAYQVIGNEKTEVPCSYRLQGNILEFKVSGRYDENYPLVIDPYTVFATFSGSKGDNWGYTATYDAEGNFYMGGIIFGNRGSYPATPGAFQTSFGGGTGAIEGGYDIAISKFDPLGRKLLYATYLGGSGDEQPHSLIVDGKGDLIISGRTNNAESFPGTLVGNGGAWDMIVSELNPSGSGLVGSLIIGGEGDDGVNIAEKESLVNGRSTYSLRRFYGDDARSEVNIGPDGNIYVAGCTQSGDFPSVGNVFQGALKGAQDAVILKLAPDLGKIIWSSFLGGVADDAAFVLNFGENGNIYLAGGTASSDFPKMGAPLQPAFGGGDCDGFIAEVTSNGSTLVRTTYLGTSAADEIYGIQLDKDGFVYVTGTTEGVWPVTANAHYPGIQMNGKQFICKLQPDLSAYVYSTVFGSANATPVSLPNISPTAFLVDRCENVYVAGWGGAVNANQYPVAGTSGLPVKNPINPRTPDGRDFYFFVLRKNATEILFASTYGQNGGLTDHVDGGTSRFDPNGIIYEAICANCGGDVSWPTGPPGVYSSRNGSGGSCNELALKIAFNLDGIRGGVATLNRRENYCIGEDVTFIDTLYGRKAYQWRWNVYNTCDLSLIKGGSLQPIARAVQDSTQQLPYEYIHPFQRAGCYTVQMIKYLPNECIEYDTSYVSVNIRSNPAVVSFRATKLKPCDSYNFHFENLSGNRDNIPFGPQAFVWDFGDGSAPDTTNEKEFDHHFPSEGNYTVRLSLIDTANFCNAPLDTVKIISVSNQLKAALEIPDTLCAPQQALFQNMSLGGTNFTWVIRKPFDLGTDSFHMGDLSPLSYQLKDSGFYLIKLYAIDTVCALEDSVVDSLVVYPTPTADFSFSPDKAINQVISFTNRSLSKFEAVDGELFYRWEFGDGNTTDEKDPQHLYAGTGTYDAILYTTNRAGCADTASHPVSETIIPKMDMPKAFTPNGDGVNDYIAPRAFGVQRVDFRIYNRWGQLVFRSLDPQVTYMENKGWDGTVNGKPQEMDVYSYVLNLEFEDGNKTTKQGSITLIR